MNHPSLPQVWALALFLALLAWTEQSLAQGAPAPSQPVLGGELERPAGRQQLTLTAGIREVYDENVFGAAAMGNNPRAAESGFPSGAINLAYVRNGRRVVVTTNAATDVQYHTRLSGRMDRHHLANLNVEVPVGRRTRVSASDAFSQATYHTLSGLPGGIPESMPGPQLLDPGVSSLVSTHGGWQHQMQARVTHQLGRRGGIDGRYGFSHGDFADVQTHQHVIGMGYTQPLTRNVGLVARYSSERVGHASGGARVALHNIDGGLNYERAFGPRRETTVGFSTGSALITRGTPQHDYRFLMDARLARAMGRSWTSAVSYRRGVEFMLALDRVVPSDSVTGSLVGGVGRGLTTSVAGTYSRGSVGGTGDVGLRTYSVVTGAQLRLTRALVFEAQYHQYLHQFGADAVLPPALASAMTRHGVQAGLTLSLPLVR